MTSPPYAEIKSWLFDAALPWWAEHGVDHAHGGFIEQVTFDGADAAIDFKRTRVACRQVYVFSHAHVLGWDGDGVAQAKRGFDWLTANAWMGDGKGFCRTTTRDGKIKDPTLDLYDQAFALFAFAWYHRATNDPEALTWAHKALDVVEAKLRHPTQPGFLHETPPTGPRQQNPHMHITEAMLALYETSGDQRFADLAREVVGLCRTKFFDLKSQTLAEFFNEDWTRAPGDDGRRVEPGHMFEWAWILTQAKRLLQVDVDADVRAMAAFGERHGVDPASGATFNAVRDDGAPIDRASRTWPNTERLKAAVALYDLDGKDPSAVFTQSGRLLLDRYLATRIPGLWVDVFDAEGKPTAKTVPTSTLYHVFLAFAEMLRVQEATRA